MLASFPWAARLQRSQSPAELQATTTLVSGHVAHDAVQVFIATARKIDLSRPSPFTTPA
jgi:hypothetical protein